MQMKISYLYAAILVLLLASCIKDEMISGLTEIKDIPYGSHPRQKIDIYLPLPAKFNHKIVLLIHGGGWVMGDKQDFYLEASYLGNRGFAVASMNYRYAGNKTGIHYLQLMQDVNAAINCIFSRSGEYGYDSSSIVVAGGSAGAHMAMLYAYGYDTLKRVKAVISMAGPADLLAPDLLAITGMKNLVNIMTGDTDLTRWNDANPAHFVNSGCPPTCFFHGMQDNIVPYSQSVAIHHKLDSLNVRSEIHLFSSSGHGFTEADTKTTLGLTEVFLNSVLF